MKEMEQKKTRKKERLSFAIVVGAEDLFLLVLLLFFISLEGKKKNKIATATAEVV